jgi:hypothetical protein
MSRLTIALCLVISASGLLLGCGGGGGERYGDDDGEYAYEEAEVESDPADVDATDVEQPEFDDCSIDCSGHEAGFSECGGSSDSFIEGCESFAEVRAEQAEEEAIESAQYEDESYDDDDSGRY